MGNNVTVLPATRERILQYIIATRGGVLDINSSDIKVTGTLARPGKPDTEITATVRALTTVLSDDISVDMYGNYTAPWEELSETEKEAIADYVLGTYGLPADPEEKLEERYILRRLNIGFIHQHGDLDESDFRTIDRLTALMKKSHRFSHGNVRPMAGDLVEGAYYDGKYPFKRGLVTTERYGKNKELLPVCAEPYIPFVQESRFHPDGYFLSVSGGPFFNFTEEDLVYAGNGTRLFNAWGHCGPCENGAIRFEVSVNRWTIRTETKY